jgi:predicted TIM-barrel fold metal-dependent hydrolase
MTLYDGPIIDAHHHLWDLGLARHPWLGEDEAGISALGDIAYMRRNYLARDYLADAAGQNVVATVAIEALWDRARDPVEETIWFEHAEKPGGVAARFVAYAKLDAPGAERAVERQAAFSRVVGLRETVRWHPDPAKRWTDRKLIDDPAWREGLRHLEKHGLLLELLMNPYQSDEVARLAADFPDQVFVIDHCASPVDRDPEGLARWRSGLQAMARMPNVAIKISNYGAYDPDRSPEGLRSTVMPCLDAFGPERTMFGSDYPVARRNMTFGHICEALKVALDDLSYSEQRAVFHDTTTRYYRIGS